MKYLLALISIASMNVHAASFDCSKASTKVEKTICSNNPLSLLDEQLADSFSKLKSQLNKKDFKILLREQRKWIKQRNKSCKNSRRIPSCLTWSYENRLHSLDLISRNIIPPLSELDAVCSGNGKRHSIDDGLFDINNDGVKEVGEKCHGGSMHTPCMKFKQPNGERIFLNTIGFEWKTYWTFNSSYFAHNGKIYNLHGADSGPSHIRYTTPKNNSYVVCEFENIETEELLPVKNTPEHKEICALSNTKNIKYVDFKDKPILSHKQIKDAGRYETGVGGQKYIDIDNDGEKELIAMVNYASGAGRGCDFLYYDELSPDGNSFSYTEGQTSLLKMQGVNLDSRHPNCGGMNNQIFEFKGKRYYEINTSNEHRISTLERNKIDNICVGTRTIKTNIKHIGPPNK
jgi:uncharacterized protein